jgi:hypothetical protein
MASQSSDGSGIGPGPTEPRSGFKPYTSILTFSSSPTRDHDASPSTKKKELAPWRRAVGRAYFAIDIEDGIGEEHEDAFGEMMERTFAGFSDEVVGADIPITDFSVLKEEPDWAVDDHPSGPQVPGEKSVLYNVEEDHIASTTTKSG